MREFFAAIEGADALLIATPEYNASLPGALKNAIDWASRPFPENVLRYKPTAVIGASTGLFGAVWAQAEVRKTMKASGAHVLESELPGRHGRLRVRRGRGRARRPRTDRSGSRTCLGDLVREVKAPVEAQ